MKCIVCVLELCIKQVDIIPLLDSFADLFARHTQLELTKKQKNMCKKLDKSRWFSVVF